MTWSALGPLIISVFALAISTLTLWLTHIRKGDVKMTPPTVLYFGPDGDRVSPKLYLRTLLYCTSAKGRVVEHLWVKLRRGETQQNFNIWVYGEDKLFRGSGLFVGPSGVSLNHHFLLPADTHNFEFRAGDYALDISAKIAGDSSPKLLHSLTVSLPDHAVAAAKRPDTGIHFDWGPDSQKYHPHVKLTPVNRTIEDR